VLERVGDTAECSRHAADTDSRMQQACS
jgi:hypothetical protein